LKREISFLNSENDNPNINEQNSASNQTDNPFDMYNLGYTKMLHLFIDGILSGKYNNIVKDIVSGCKEITIKLFEDMNKDQSLSIYNFIIKYKQLLGLSDEILDKVKEYGIKNKEAISLKKKEYGIKNKEEISKRRKAKYKLKMIIFILHKLHR
jgi:hypothetical protein